MVRSEDFQCYQQPPAFGSLDLNHMSTLLQTRRLNVLPSAVDASSFSKFSFSRGPISGFPDLKAGTSIPPYSTCLLGSEPAEADGFRQDKGTADDFTGGNQKKFLIFDQSGCQTRLFVSAFSPLEHHPNIASIRNARACHVQEENQAVVCEKFSALEPVIEERFQENYKFHGEGDMHEDTEEINALLYSDNDDTDDDYDDGQNDEEKSSGRSPLAFKGTYDKDAQLSYKEEVASSDCSYKRQKLADGGYKFSFDNIPELDDDADSSCANDKNLIKDASFFTAKCMSQKGKIQETLRILKGIVPDVKGKKDPLLVIDEAISYLKYLRHEARTMGFNYS